MKEERAAGSGGRLGRALALLGLFAAACFLGAGAFLAAPAVAPRRADAIVVLGGDNGPRALKGLELYRGGYAPRVLLPILEEKGPFTRRYSVDERSRALLAGGVPKEAVEFVGGAGNSWQEAEKTLRLAETRGWLTVIVVSDPPHMRRLQWTWRRVPGGSGISAVLVSSDPAWWHAGSWWAGRDSARFVLSEYAKLLYYFWKYRPGERYVPRPAGKTP